jgi:hypothetical protein
MQSASAFSQALRDAAPGLSRRFFQCSSRRCTSSSSFSNLRARQFRLGTRELHSSHHRFRDVGSQSAFLSSRGQAPKSLQASSQTHYQRAFSASTTARNSTPPTVAENVGTQDKEQRETGHQNEKKQERRSFFPDTSSNIVAYWLLGSAASVFGIVVFGGLTRLTESG